MMLNPSHCMRNFEHFVHPVHELTFPFFPTDINSETTLASLMC